VGVLGAHPFIDVLAADLENDPGRPRFHGHLPHVAMRRIVDARMTDEDRTPPGGADEEEGELRPPSAERVARRALVLAAVVCRSAIEGDAGNAEAEAFRQSVLAWTETIGIAPEMESDEMKLLRTPLGGLTSRERIDGTWRAEGLAVLGWALGRSELPPYDVGADPLAVADALGFREAANETVLADARLRAPEELVALADELLALHWRLRQYSLDGKAIDFKSTAAKAWFGPLPIARLRLAEGDLELRGVPIFRAPEALWREAMSIASERQQAANWLMGQDEIYSEVTTDT
jgi:hypothetical protein